MIARNVLAIAPRARIWDAPLLPLENEQDAPPRLSDLGHLFHWIGDTVKNGRAQAWDQESKKPIEAKVSGPWIMVNAWAVMDPESDAELHRYADDPDHMFINDVARLNEIGIDIVFAAGNCGEPCPDRRCGDDDTGPGRSISGLNGHPDVLTVGAVRGDGMPIAISAQGPGRLANWGSRKCHDYRKSVTLRAYEKPDLCAPSHFRESDDASETNTGTSAACGYAAGVLAALRSCEPRDTRLAPSDMRALLRSTAVGTNSLWDPRVGHGVIKADLAFAALPNWLRQRGRPGKT
jgi:subtilase family protein